MGDAAVLVFLMFFLIAAGAWIIPKPPARKPPDITAEFFDRRR